jgi:hypothetical protein
VAAARQAAVGGHERREHHLLVAAAQAALGRDDLESAKLLLKQAQKLAETAHFFAAAAELAAARGNHRGTKERLRQALAADPALAPHLLPGLVAAEEAIDAGETPKKDELADDADEAPTKSEKPAESLALATTSDTTATDKDKTVALVPSTKPVATVTDRVLATLAEVDAQLPTPRLELALIRAQLAPPTDGRDLATELSTKFPDAVAARVAAARLALGSGDPAAIKGALEVFVADGGALAWALRGRWQCSNCGHRPGPFSWRCGSCRRWGTLRMETGIEPVPVAPRDRRQAPRQRPDGLLGTTPDVSLPTPTLDSGLGEDELARAGTKRSVLGRVGGWLSRAWRRGA